MRFKLAKMSMSDLKKLCNTMNVDHSLWSTFVPSEQSS